MIAISYDDVAEYVMQRDRERPKTEQTVFLFKPLAHCAQRKFLNLVGSNMQALASLAQAAESGEAVPTMGALPLGEIIDVVVPNSLSGWRNFKDAQGKDVIWKGNGKGGMELEQMNLFDLTSLVEMVGAVISHSFLSEEDRKN
jgi:hypothetical protein